MKQILGAIFLIVGSIIGAGFASGREISLFFAEFGWNSLYFLPIVFIFFYYTFKMFLSLGSEQKFKNVFEINAISGSSPFFNVSVVLAFFMYSAAMFAASVEILSNYFIQISPVIFNLVVLICSFLVLTFGFKGLVRVNFILTPVIVALLIVYVVYSSLVPITFMPYVPETNGAHILPISILMYVFGNILLSYFILAQAGNGLTAKQIQKASLGAAIIICLALLAGIICLIINGTVVMDASMPFLALSLRLGEPFPFIFMAILFLGVISSLFGCLHTVTSAFETKFGSKSPFVVCALVGIASLVGFDNIVNHAYPILGIAGIIITSKIAFFSPKTKPKLHT